MEEDQPVPVLLQAHPCRGTLRRKSGIPIWAEHRLTVPPIQSFIALRELGKSLRKIRWKHGEATTALTDDLVVYTVVRKPPFSPRQDALADMATETDWIPQHHVRHQRDPQLAYGRPWPGYRLSTQLPELRHPAAPWLHPG